ncbi:MAG: SBBP repeat-containing protein, partial [Candidatus Asgardarchaeum sp.]
GIYDYDLLLMKFDSEGNKVWERVWGDYEYECGMSLVLYEDTYLYVTGYTSSYGSGEYDILILKFTTDGTKQWERVWGGTKNDVGLDITVDNNEYIYVTGYTSSYTAGDADVFVLKYDNQGNMIWNMTWGGPDDDVPTGICVDDKDNVYIVGYTSSYTKFDGSDIFILMLDNNGTIINKEIIGSLRNDFSSSILFRNNTIYIFWYSEEEYSYITAFTLNNNTFKELWQLSPPSEEECMCGNCFVDQFGIIYFIGSIKNDDNWDIFLAIFSEDSDYDQLSDWDEIVLGTNPFDKDTDNDKLSDYYEAIYSLNPLFNDTDNDGIIDGDEVDMNTNPCSNDTDADEISDGDEINIYHTDPIKPDTDGDGIFDGWEIQYELDPLNISDGNMDLDGDGLSNYQEFIYGSDPYVIDTDGDEIIDGDEISRGTSPRFWDSDGDGISDSIDPIPTINNWIIIINIFMTITIMIIIHWKKILKVPRRLKILSK